jgi:hypothetical protein
VSGGVGSDRLGRGRRRPEPQPRRGFKVKLSDAEREQLEARAEELWVSVPRRRTIAELFEVRRLLATVANNVNQLARAANISGDVGSEARLARTLAEVDQLVLRLRELTGGRR